jgi:hypothetical protein
VRAATGFAGGIAGADAAKVFAEKTVLWSLIGAPPLRGLEQRLRRTVFKNRAAAWKARQLLGSSRHYLRVAASSQRIISRASLRKSHKLGSTGIPRRWTYGAPLCILD